METRHRLTGSGRRDRADCSLNVHIRTGTVSHRLAHAQARQNAQNGRAQPKRPAE
jgi:hypothetical protein